MSQFTETIEKIISGKHVVENTIGESGDKVYKIENIEDNQNGYLKVEGTKKDFGIKHEYEVYKFLDGKINVSKVYYYEYPYLITTEVEGIGSFHVEKDERLNVVRVIARSLKMLHSIDISECNLYSELEWGIRGEKYTKEQLYDIGSDDYVFVHGDACLPNIIINEGEFSGFIDMGSAGIGNRYEDLAYCTWSILYNFKDVKYVDEFFNEYGNEYYHREKINSYIKLLGPSTILEL